MEANPASASVRVLHLTDTHFPPHVGARMQGVDTLASFDAVTASISASERTYDLLLLTGDLVHEPSPFGYRLLRSRLRTVWPDTPCYYLPGNHDDPGMMQHYLSDETIRYDVTVELDHWRIVLLNSRIDGEDGGRLEESQFRLLQHAIDQCPPKHLLVAVHHHPMPCGSRWMDTMVIANGSRLLDVLTTGPAGTRAVVFGHIHQAFDRTIGSIHLLGSPATCVQFKPQSDSFALDDDLPPAYRWIDLHRDGSIDSKAVYVPLP